MLSSMAVCMNFLSLSSSVHRRAVCLCSQTISWVKFFFFSRDTREFFTTIFCSRKSMNNVFYCSLVKIHRQKYFHHVIVAVPKSNLEYFFSSKSTFFAIDCLPFVTGFGKNKCEFVLVDMSHCHVIYWTRNVFESEIELWNR